MLTEHNDIQYDKVAKMALLVVATLSSSKGSSPTSSPNTSDNRQAPPTQEHKESQQPPPVAPRTGGKQAGKQQLQVVQPQLNKYFHMFMVELLKLFEGNRVLLEDKGSFIIR